MNSGERLIYSRCLKICVTTFPGVSVYSIIQCCREWVSNGNTLPPGIVNFYNDNYLNQ